MPSLASLLFDVSPSIVPRADIDTG